MRGPHPCPCQMFMHAGRQAGRHASSWRCAAPTPARPALPTFHLCRARKGRASRQRPRQPRRQHAPKGRVHKRHRSSRGSRSGHRRSLRLVRRARLPLHWASGRRGRRCRHSGSSCRCHGRLRRRGGPCRSCRPAAARLQHAGQGGYAGGPPREESGQHQQQLAQHQPLGGLRLWPHLRQAGAHAGEQRGRGSCSRRRRLASPAAAAAPALLLLLLLLLWLLLLLLLLLCAA